MSTAPATRPLIPVIHAGEDLVVHTLAGAEITVKVAAVPIRHMGVFVDLFDKPCQLAEFIVHADSKPVAEGWADALSDESLYAIRQKAKELNLERALAWADRQIEAGRALAVPITERLVSLAELKG